MYNTVCVLCRRRCVAGAVQASVMGRKVLLESTGRDGGQCHSRVTSLCDRASTLLSAAIHDSPATQPSIYVNDHQLHMVCSLYATVLASLIFRSRKKFSTTYAIVLFFSPDLFMKISNFSKTVHTIFTKFCTVILHPKGPLRAQRHQNRDWK